MRSPHVVVAFLLLGVACSREDAAVVDSGAVATAAPASALPPAIDTAAKAALADPDSVIPVEVRDATGRALGTLSLRDATRGITVTGQLNGLPPGAHAIHLHTSGRCEPPFGSAAGHWNPTNREHGMDNPRGPHLGDLPNISAGPDSVASVQVTSPDGRLRGPNGLLDADGAAVVVHAAADDNRTDPAGNAGGRIACGVVSGR